VVPVFLSYVLSFVYVGIYWNTTTTCCTRASRSQADLVANLHLLFWLSLFPFATAWMGENYHAMLPSAAYGAVLLVAALAYVILQQAIIAAQGPGSLLKQAVGGDWKGKLSPCFMRSESRPRSGRRRSRRPSTRCRGDVLCRIDASSTCWRPGKIES